MNSAQRIIVGAVYFTVCIAALREGIYDKNHDCGFRYPVFFMEIGAVLMLGWIARLIAKWNK